MVKSDMLEYLGLEESEIQGIHDSKETNIVFKTDRISSGLQLADCLNLKEGLTSDLGFSRLHIGENQVNCDIQKNVTEKI